jgi:hypothetical protein
MELNGRVQVSVSRPVAASVAEIFLVLADPANHQALDGSGMLRGAQPSYRLRARPADCLQLA